MDTCASSSLPQRKMSRYRSQRPAIATNVPGLPTVPAQPANEQEAIAKSRSRYHNRTSAPVRQSLKEDGSPLVISTSQGQISQPGAASYSPSSGLYHYSRIDQAAGLVASRGSGSADGHRVGRIDSDGALQSPVSQQSIGSEPSRFNSPPPTGELFPPLRPTTPPAVDGPPRSDRIRATKSAMPLTNPPSSKLASFFGRDHNKRTSKDLKAKEVKQASTVIADAPISAVNAGERRVLVECGNARLMFPVTPETTPEDLIKSAATTMNENINVNSAVMLEHFSTVGVHRPLRRYEKVRDVMNSWDDDRQNTLIIVDPSVGKSEDELSLAGCPKQRMKEERKFSMYYSHTVGKWDLRGIILKTNGQIAMVKDPRRPWDQSNICRLDDFDIYTPTPEKIKKKIKPPKKHCFAIKSQQKSTMFETTKNFVHFFSMADQAEADAFYMSVQRWRSWWLVHTFKLGGPAMHPPHPRETAHHRLDSLRSYYQLGSFAPLFSEEDHMKDTDSWHEHVEDRLLADRVSNLKPEVLSTLLAKDEPLGNIHRKLSVRVGVSPRGKLAPPIKDPVPIHRMESTRRHAQQRPLVDIGTPARAPTKKSKGKAYCPPTSSGSGLIEAATSLVIDETTGQPRARTSLDVSRPNYAPAYRPGLDSEAAFTGGLLAAAGDGWGGNDKGKGIMDGKHATGPMVDLSEASQFAKGSLLRRVEKQQGQQGVLIDRSERRERVVKTGEGF